MNARIKEKLSLLPMDPGCYLMKDKQGDIIYVGKAKHLKNRVSSYFVGAHDFKTTQMVAMVHDFDIIVTGTEKESLILEINLIKEHRPRFNILFMDDKSYPYLRLNKEGKPLVEVSRDRKLNPKYTYYGPYPNAKAARDMASLLNETLPSESGFKPNRENIYTTLNRTQKMFTKEELESWRQYLHRILSGHDQSFQKDLENKMYEASTSLHFELANLYKEKLEALAYISDRQQVQFNVSEQFDSFAYATYQGYVAIVGLFVRAGKLLEKTMALEATMEDPEDAFLSFVVQFYQNQPLPKAIYLPHTVDLEPVVALLDTTIMHAQRGKKRKLIEMGERNAELQLKDQFHILWNREKSRVDALENLRTILNLNKPLQRIEIFDNSHISGDFAVSACVVFDQGEPNKDQYRRYQLSTGADDVASMKEVVYRRYFRLLREKRRMPDLIVIDGGYAQLHAAKETIEDLGLNIPMISLVKDHRHRTRGILLPNETEIPVRIQDPMYAFLTKMQDEVHRYVIAYHRNLRKKAQTRSLLDEVEGLGKVRQKKLYQYFGSLKHMRNATLEDLEALLPATVANELYRILHLDWDEADEKN